MPSLGAIVAYCTLAALQGVLVFLPRPVGSDARVRLRSPGWALVLPGALLVGTFGVLAVPDAATWLVVLAAAAAPLLIGVAMLGVVRGRRGAWLAVLPVLVASAVALHSWPAALASSALTALGCLTVGAGLVRLTPLPWLAGGIAAMCLVDVALLATGVGEPVARQMDIALSHSPLPDLRRAQLGPVSKDYPDLVLAAVLGSALAGSARQLTAAVLVAVLSCANGVLFLVADLLPATAPVGAAAGIVVLIERRSRRTRRPPGDRRRRWLRRGPPAAEPVEA